jgi:DeoR/GlpR family transcriptional regulator of sugar metabolism
LVPLGRVAAPLIPKKTGTAAQSSGSKLPRHRLSVALAVKQVMLDSASHVVAVITADKLGAVEPFVVAPCNRIHTLMTECHVASGDVGDYRKLGIEVVQAGA